MEYESYDTWKTGWNSLGSPSCTECESHEQRIDECREFLSEIVEQLSKSSELDLSIVEHCLDELCHRIGVKTFIGDLTIQRREKVIEKPVKWLEIAL